MSASLVDLKQTHAVTLTQDDVRQLFASEFDFVRLSRTLGELDEKIEALQKAIRGNQSTCDDLKSALGEIDSVRQQLSATGDADTSTRNEIMLAREEITTASQNVQSIHSAVRTMCKNVQAAHDTIAEANGAIAAARNQLKEHVETGQAAQAAQAAGHAALGDTIGEMSRSLQPILNQGAGVGEDGFLHTTCIAPTGWNQRIYEAALIRAAHFYIKLLGSPDAGVSADEDAMNETRTEFPLLDHTHLRPALEHVHIQRYDCVLRYS
ncbi:hypothetical protein F4782DRAFT_534532 [Xylaria castorea]|nr:hypothetical protein F4782DRAFT_534532 [Xylaria castorea]